MHHPHSESKQGHHFDTEDILYPLMAAKNAVDPLRYINTMANEIENLPKEVLVHQLDAKMD